MGTPTYILLLMLSGLSLNITSATGKDIFIMWSKSGVQQFLSSPLQVSIGDILFLECMPGSYSNVYYMVDQAQYMNCDGSLGTNAILGSCLDSVNGRRRNIIITVTQNSDSSVGTVQFQPDQMYFFASFSNGKSLRDALGSSTSGGQCTDGLKLAIQVLSLDNPTGPKKTKIRLSMDNTTTRGSNSTSASDGVSPKISGKQIIIIIAICVPVFMIVSFVVLLLICCVASYCNSQKYSVDIDQESLNRRGSTNGTVLRKGWVDESSGVQTKTKTGEKKNGVKLVEKREQDKSDRKVRSDNKRSKSGRDKLRNTNSSKVSEITRNVQESSTTRNPPRNILSPPKKRSTKREKNLREKNGTSEPGNRSDGVPSNLLSNPSRNKPRSKQKRGLSRLPSNTTYQ